jgi:hypothetical protein
MERTSEESANPPRPRDIDRGVKLAYASLLFGIVADVVDFRHFFTLDNLTTFVFTYGIFLFLILKVSSGRNWARIVLLLISLVGLGFLGLYPRWLLVEAFRRNPRVFLQIVPGLLQCAALFFWFRRGSGAWFKDHSTNA